MTWQHTGNKSLSEPMAYHAVMHICITRPELTQIILRTLKRQSTYATWSRSQYKVSLSRCRDSHHKNGCETYLYNGNSYIGKTTSLYWDSPKALMGELWCILWVFGRYLMFYNGTIMGVPLSPMCLEALTYISMCSSRWLFWNKNQFSWYWDWKVKASSSPPVRWPLYIKIDPWISNISL